MVTYRFLSDCVRAAARGAISLGPAPTGPRPHPLNWKDIKEFIDSGWRRPFEADREAGHALRRI